MTALRFSRHAAAAILVGVLAGVAFGGSSRGVVAAETALLSGKVVSSTGDRLAGIPVRARRTSSTIAVTVYTNGAIFVILFVSLALLTRLSSQVSLCQMSFAALVMIFSS